MSCAFFCVVLPFVVSFVVVVSFVSDCIIIVILCLAFVVWCVVVDSCSLCAVYWLLFVGCCLVLFVVGVQSWCFGDAVLNLSVVVSLCCVVCSVRFFCLLFGCVVLPFVVCGCRLVWFVVGRRYVLALSAFDDDLSFYLLLLCLLGVCLCLFYVGCCLLVVVVGMLSFGFGCWLLVGDGLFVGSRLIAMHGCLRR